MKFSSFGKYISFLCLTLLSLYIYFYLQSSISIDDFDTTVYLSILKNFLDTNVIYIPSAFDYSQLICNSDFNCLSESIDHSKQQYTVVPSYFTSGLSLLFIPKLIHLVLDIFADNLISITYLKRIYSGGAALIFFITNFFAIYFFNFNKSDLFRYLMISIILIYLILELSAYGVIGELYSSLFLIAPTLLIFLNINLKNTKFLTFLILIIFLGISFEAKLTSIPVSSLLLLLLIIKSCDFSKKFSFLTLKKLSIIIFSFLLPKLIVFLYIFFLVDGSLVQFSKAIFSGFGEISYNLNAGLNWKDRGPLDQFLMIYDFNKFKLLVFVVIFFLFYSLYNYYKTKRMIYLYFPFFVFFTLFIPLFLKFPYYRLFTFFSLACGVSLLLFKEIFRKYIFFEFFILFLIILFFYKPLPNSNDNNSFFDVYEAFPDLHKNRNTFLVTGHFFAFPWDLYLNNILNANGPLYTFNTISVNSLNFIQDQERAEVFFAMFTCKWGHCPNDQVIEISNYYCDSLDAYKKTNYKIYQCKK